MPFCTASARPAQTKHGGTAVKSISDIPYKEGLCFDLHLPEATHFPLFLYFHGGGLTEGDKASALHFADDLTSCGIAVASANYGLHPRAHYPEYLCDAADAVAAVSRRIGEWGHCDGLYVGGSSAGAYLTMMLCFCGSYLARVGMKPADIDGWIHDSGQPTVHFHVLRERGLDPRRVIVDEAAPLYWIGTGETPNRMLVLVSDGDMEGRPAQTRLTEATLRHFGIGEEIAAFRVLHGSHCAHIGKTDEHGKNVFGEIVRRFIFRQSY